jgi:hypothetical protein
MREALALAVLLATAQPAAAEATASDLSFHRVEVTSGSRIPASLADRLRDELAARLPRRAGEPATLNVTIVDAQEDSDGDLQITAIVAARADRTHELYAEFDVEAHTRVTETANAPAAALEAAQASALADQIMVRLGLR